MRLDSQTRRALVTALLLAAAFALRATVADDPGPLFLVPVILGALWFDWRGGLVTAAVAAVLYAAGSAVSGKHGVGLFTSTVIRFAAYVVVSYAVGKLAEQRNALRTTVAEQGRELGELRSIQRALAPRHPPSRPSLDLASCYVPAQQGAAGDFYLVAAGPRDSTIVVVGDVAGKGVEASRRAAFARTAFASAAPSTDDPCRLLELANTALLGEPNDQNMFVTCACIVFSPRDRRMTWALAGHPPPMWLDDGTPLNSVVPAFPLGVEPQLTCTSASAYFEPGSGLMAFTDGLSEARRGGGELFGTDRIALRLHSLRGASPARIVRELRRDAERFAGGALPDDLCIVALRAS